MATKLWKEYVDKRLHFQTCRCTSEMVRANSWQIPTTLRSITPQNGKREWEREGAVVGYFDFHCQTVLCQNGITSAVTPAVACSVWKRNGRSRTITILHTTFRLTMRLSSAHISPYDVNFAGNGTLRSRVTQRSEPMLHVLRGSNWATVRATCDPFHLGHADILRQHESAPAGRATCGERVPIDILALGTLTHKSPRSLQVGSATSASSILAGCLHDESESHAASTRCGKNRQERERPWTLTCKSTLLANDKSLEKLIVGHLVAEGVPTSQGTAATDLGIETAAV